MNFDLSTLLLLGCGYLLLLFGAAWLTERKRLPDRLIHHPLVHVLALGVFASAWTFYGIFGVAHQSGYLYLVSYLGASAAFLLAPLILIPILRITRRHQLSSLADLFAFRFRSGRVGTLTTLLMLFTSLPLISIQIQALADSLPMLNPQISSNQAAIGFCAVIALFTILFGARHASLRNSHNGLIFAIATESLVKLLALLIIAGYALFAVLDGPSGLIDWLSEHPEQLQQLRQPPVDHWQVLLLAFFACAFVMPHMFHVAFTENLPTESLYRASWGLPLFLLLLALAVPPILWAAIKSNAIDNPEYLVIQLGQTLQLPWLSLLAFIGGLSAASGIIIVATVALASMLQNHVVLPLVKVPDNVRFYAWLLWVRRLIILAVMLGSYLFFHFIGHRFALNQLGLLAFIAFLQFLPGVLVTLYWPAASRNGFLAGVGAGFTVWALGLLLPMMGALETGMDPARPAEHGYQIALVSLLANSLVLVTVSLLFPGRREERQAAEACLLNALPRPSDQGIQVQSDADFVNRLMPRLGENTAVREVRRALHELQLPVGRLSPLDSLRLRAQLEQNLSGLLGPVEAAALLQPLDTPASSGGFKARNVHLLEQQLEAYDQRLSGLAAELDQLRRYHRATLQRLPIGVCTLDAEQRILFWNAELEAYTGLTSDSTLGVLLDQLPKPWSELLERFAATDALHQSAECIELEGAQRWFSLHKARLDDTPAQGVVLLIEEETQHQLMARKLAHSERLASIGRFAAGVAHEIGNPVTGIACLAQNLKLETEQPEVLETGDQIVDQTRRINRIVQSLIRFAHTGRQEGPGHLEPLNLFSCIEEAIHLVTLDRHGRQQHFVNNVDQKLLIQGDLQLLLQVFVNLLNNASDASPAESDILIDSEVNEHSSRILITDEGCGIPEEHLEQLFEPFFTTKEPGKGTGLGLPLVYNIITQHYGSIEIVSPANKKQNKGTRVIITLPRLQGSASAEQPEADGEGLSG
ncbi:sensor histidine kinase [Marinobacterium sediminicola]|uniref:histidine kinase n=1 Tax=Marinobacterium sediminicola TaxID=518898 RepID=A0ABY1S490_9GAMM|nr:ATP-binding protein [Marinobacterium sediminicola]ULG68896.1 ATP-binding protein [Marinobacterium sediminicola]SMR77902.1 Two-component sensor kinase CbrA [Marinobacterium sediminicola]